MSARPPGWVSGRAEHDADLLPDLVGEQADRVGAVQVAGQLAQRLRHQARLEPDVRVAHLPLELDARGERRDRVHGDDVDRAGADQDVDDLERLFAVIRLGDHQLVGVDADLARVDGVERVLGVDEGADASARLGLGDDVVDERRLTRGLRAEDLHDAAPRHTADAERDVERQRARGNRLHVERAHVAELHQRTLPELLLDLRDGRVQRLVARLRLFLAGVSQVGLLLCHLTHLSVSWSSWAVGSSNSANGSYSAPVLRRWDLKSTMRVGRKNRNICSGSG